MTKILTALVAIEWLDPDGIVTVGSEIYGLPADYATSVHFEGETITVRNLLRSLMINSTNEAGNIVAVNTIRAKEQMESITNEEALKRFLQLMNEKAVELGATSSNFNNTYGLHSEGHFTTAVDRALISRAYMENALLRDIAATREYGGDSLEGRIMDGARVKNYSWVNHNELLLGGTNGYPYANGIKTGFHDDAGDCVTASATRDGVTLIAVVFFSEDPGRWQDSRLLFDYGFETFTHRQFQQDGELIDPMPMENTQLGAATEMEVYLNGDANAYLSEDELEEIKREIDYDPLYISDVETEDGITRLKTPIDKDMPLGTVSYTLDGEVLFSSTIHAAADAPARTMDSDMDYYIQLVKDNVFTLKGLPYWFGAVGFLVGIIGIAVALSGRKNRGERYRGSRYKPYKRGRR
jgi:D-alanyl-D-alanine carboxypeptidase (penicillin-binding protein 5/6)